VARSINELMMRFHNSQPLPRQNEDWRAIHDLYIYIYKRTNNQVSLSCSHLLWYYDTVKNTMFNSINLNSLKHSMRILILFNYYNNCKKTVHYIFYTTVAAHWCEPEPYHLWTLRRCSSFDLCGPIIYQRFWFNSNK
jgi:hypothetical protein